MDEVTAAQLDMLKCAEENLKRQLDWVSRFDSRVSFTVGIALAMLGIIATVTPKFPLWTIELGTTSTMAVLLIGGSIFYMYRAQYPNTKSPNASLLFFGEIANLESADYHEKFRALTSDAYIEDLLHQAHVNAQIVTTKFGHLKAALQCLLMSAIPWLATILVSKSISP